MIADHDPSWLTTTFAQLTERVSMAAPALMLTGDDHDPAVVQLGAWLRDNVESPAPGDVQGAVRRGLEAEGATASLAAENDRAGIEGLALALASRSDLPEAVARLAERRDA